MEWIRLDDVDITPENTSIISDGLYLVRDFAGNYTIVERFFGSWQPYSAGSEDFEIFEFCKIK